MDRTHFCLDLKRIASRDFCEFHFSIGVFSSFQNVSTHLEIAEERKGRCVTRQQFNSIQFNAMDCMCVCVCLLFGVVFAGVLNNKGMTTTTSAAGQPTERELI